MNVLRQKKGTLAFAALMAGATCIGVAPILVRLSEIGPSATAGFRLLFALPFLWVWTLLDRNRVVVTSAQRRGFIGLAALAGFLFAGDMAFWHWSLRFTSVANSTLFTNFAPFLVTIGAHFLLGEKITWAVLAGMGLAFAGGSLLVLHSFNLSASYLIGDLLALVTAIFYAGYLLAVKRLREAHSTSKVMFFSGLVSCPLLFAAGWLSLEKIMPDTGPGFGVLVGLAIISHIGGQCLIAYSLAHLPASFSSVALLWQPVVAAILAATLLGEKLSVLTLLGGTIVLFGIAVASGLFPFSGPKRSSKDRKDQAAT